MFKKILLIGLVLGLLAFYPNPAIAQTDSSKVFVYANGFLNLPTDEGAGTYDPYFGFQFEGHYKVGTHVSVEGTYKSWRAKAEATTNDMTATYKGAGLTYWVNPYGSNFNLGFMGEVGQSKVTDDTGTNQNLGEVYGMILTKHVYQHVFLVGTVKIVRPEDVDKDCLQVSLGMGAPIEF